MRSISYYLKLVFTLVVFALGIYTIWLSYIWGYSIIIYFSLASIVIGVFIWIISGKIATTDLLINALTIFKRVKPISAEQIESAQKGYFVLKSEAIEKRSGVGFHLSEALEKPLFPILFLIGILTIVSRYTGTQEVYTIENSLIITFGSVLLGFIVPTIWIIKDSNWMFFDHTKRKVIKASEWLENIFKGFASAGTILGFIALFISFGGVWDLFYFVILFVLGTAGFIIVVTVFFYLFFHRKYVETVNSKLEERGFVAAELHIKPVGE